MTDAIGHSFTGRLPGVTLNSEGVAQAKQLGRRLNAAGIRKIYSSPSTRALETANSLGQTLGLEVIEEPCFSEIEVGEWSGQLFEDLNARPDFRLFNSVRSLSRPPGGEMMIEVQGRVVGRLLQLAQQHDGETVAVVSHSDVIKAALAYFLGTPLDLAYRLEIGLCSHSILRLGSGTAHVIAINRDVQD